MTPVETLKAVRAIIAEAEDMKGAYFFRPISGAGARRAFERKHTHPVVEWTEGGHEYSAEFCVACSCRNVYARGYYYRDGQKTTITTIRNSAARLARNLGEVSA